MTVVEDTVGRQCLRELGRSDMRREEVFEILPAHTRVQTSLLHHCALEAYIAGLEQAWEIFEQILDSSCSAEQSRGAPADEARHAFEVAMQRMNQLVSRDLRDVS